MAILYPDQINNVYIQGTEFTGTIVSVGSDGEYSYDYSDPATAFSSVAAGTLILIYPGTYYIDGSTQITKNLYVRGMGNSTTDVRLEVLDDTTTLELTTTNYTNVLFENFYCRGNHAGGGRVLEITYGTTNTNIYLNKMYILGVDAGYSEIYFYDGWAHAYSAYTGNIYITNSKLGYLTHITRDMYGIGQGNASATYYFVGIEFYNPSSIEPYYVDNAFLPDPHIYVVNPTPGYGYGYGDYLIEFNVPTVTPLLEAVYQNVWSSGDYIYHTTNSGINVYNSDVSSLLYQISAPTPTAVWANEDAVYISTVAAGVYKRTLPLPSSGTVYASAYKQEPYITSNYTMYLHGYGNYLSVSTLLGIDRYDLTTGSGISTNKRYLHKCFQTTSGTVYYIENTRFYSVSEDDLGDALRNWNYYQYITFDPTNIDNAQVYITIPNTFSFTVCKPNGEDLRFISNEYEVLNYYIESWYPSGRVVVKVPSAGTTGFYMLYGNNQAPAQSDPGSAYLLYDDFDGTSLDTTKWSTILNGDGIVTVQDGYVQFHDRDYDWVGISTLDKIPYGLVEARLRIQPIKDGRTKFRMGWSTVDISLGNSVGRGFVYIDGIYYNVRHQLHPYYDSIVQGVEEHQLSWRTWQFLMTEGLQSSDYNNEYLTATGTGLPTTPEFYYVFYQSGLDGNGYIQVDYVKISSYPTNETTTSTEQSLWDTNKPKLHVVYEPTTDWIIADYTYDEFYADPGMLNDIHVTSGTVFLGTDRGAHVIEELPGNEINARKKYFFID